MNAGIVTYRKNPLYMEHNTEEQPQLFAELDLTSLGVEDKVRNLPIYYQMLSKPVGPIRVIYTTNIAGLNFEAGNLRRLEEIIVDTVRVLIRFERLPKYVYQIVENAWPIYQLSDELVTRYPGGPVFNAEDIGGLRVWLAEHFKELGRIQHRREMDLLCLSPFDLQLYAPSFVLRTPGETIPDIPVFPVPGERSMGMVAPVGGEMISTADDHSFRIFEIQSAVGNHLVRQGVLQDSFESTIRKLSLEAWESLRDALSPDEHRLTYIRQRDGKRFQQTLPVFRHGDILAVGRINRINRVVLYSARNLTELVRRVGEDLHYYGAIEDPNDVKSEAAELMAVSASF